MSQPVVIVGSRGESTPRIFYHYLKQHFEIACVILEERVSRAVMIKRRIRKLGSLHVAGQLAFQVGVCPILRRCAGSRREQIMESCGLRDGPIEESLIVRVPSVNSEETRLELGKYSGGVVVIAGTRIIGPETLDSTRAPFINTHAGMTPMYRGVHGGYWALATGEPHLCGVTVHLVDQGIDTGGILYQERIYPGKDDNFTTYPLLQQAKGLPLLKKAVRDGLDGRLRTRAPLDTTSRLWSHPTLWSYLAARLAKGVG